MWAVGAVDVLEERKACGGNIEASLGLWWLCGSVGL